MTSKSSQPSLKRKLQDTPNLVRIMFTGNINIGRGIDKILLTSSPMPHGITDDDGTTIVNKAIELYGALPPNRPAGYVFGNLEAIVNDAKPQIKVCNFETVLTIGGEAASEKRELFRTHPDNLEALKPLDINCAVLGNDHVCDFGPVAISDTLTAFNNSRIKVAGAGRNKIEAEMPAIFEVQKGRVLVFAYGSQSAGVKLATSATESRAGVNYVDETIETEAKRVLDYVKKQKTPGDLVIVSIHWGDEFGFGIEETQSEFAHHLIDSQLVDVVHGHGSRHIKALEIYKNKLVIYGCGDLVSDLEGVKVNYPVFRTNLGFLYFGEFDTNNGNLISLILAPTRTNLFQVGPADGADKQWLFETTRDEVKRCGADFEIDGGRFRLTLPKEGSQGEERDVSKAVGAEAMVPGLSKPGPSSGPPPPKIQEKEIDMSVNVDLSADRIIVGATSDSARTADDVVDEPFLDERPMNERFVDSLLIKDGDEYRTSSMVQFAEKKLILFCFAYSALSGSMKSAVAQLKDFVGKCNKAQVAVVIASLDKTDEDYQETLKLADDGWGVIPYTDSAARVLFRKKYYVKHAPSVMVAGPDGIRIRKDVLDEIKDATDEKELGLIVCD